MKFCTITQTSPWRKGRDYDCHSGDEDVRTERGSDLSLVPRTSRALLAMLFLEESPLYSLLYTEPPGSSLLGLGGMFADSVPRPPWCFSHSQPHPGSRPRPNWPHSAAAEPQGCQSSASATWHAGSGTRSGGVGGEREDDQPQGFSPSSTFPSV